ncbi:hypothetical protein BGZ67_005231 [Mortierella alpina]|nr:hypothetical protein BGZ67_005231 [Mortierella alpina]
MTPSSAVPADVKVKPSRRSTAHPHPYLTGNFYPVFEETVGEEGIECEVIGVIPESLRGSQYIRTGPNSLNIPDDTSRHSFFDGDGMLHGVYFQPGENDNSPIRARYMNRYVRSDHFHKTNKHGQVTLSVGTLMNGGLSVMKVIKETALPLFKSVLCRLTNLSTGNTALAFIGNRALALQEAGTPIETTVPSLATLGEYYFEEEGQKRPKKWKPNTEVCTAHPKPYAFYCVVSADGHRKIWEEPIPGFNRPTMMHDFAVTPTHSIIMDLNFRLDPIKNIRRRKPLIAFDESLPARFGIIPRHFNHKKHKVLWFETRPCHIFHTANAWDELDAEGNVVAVCMTAYRSERFISDINLWTATGPDNYGGGKTVEELRRQYVVPGNGDYDHQDPDGAYLTLYRFDFKTMETRLTTLSTMTAEFPVINFDWFMRPEQCYVYAATALNPVPGEGVKTNGIIKVDVQAVIEKQRELLRQGPLQNLGGHGRWELGAEALLQVERDTSKAYFYGGKYFGGEAVYVPNLPREKGEVLEEDDGYLLVYVYDESQIKDGVVKDDEGQVTELWILDARKLGPSDGPVARVKIPRRVPYGFHGLHVTREQIQGNQKMLERRLRH